MNDSPLHKRYPNSAILLHWLVLLLVVAAYACILLRTNFERGSDIREGLKAWHFMLGLSVLAATFLVLGVLPLVFLRQIGFAVAVGVLLDTFIIRSTLVPALAYDIGPKIWWPSKLAKADEPEPTPEPTAVA